LQDKLTN